MRARSWRKRSATRSIPAARFPDRMRERDEPEAAQPGDFLIVTRNTSKLEPLRAPSSRPWAFRTR